MFLIQARPPLSNYCEKKPEQNHKKSCSAKRQSWKEREEKRQTDAFARSLELSLLILKHTQYVSSNSRSDGGKFKIVSSCDDLGNGEERFGFCSKTPGTLPNRTMVGLVISITLLRYKRDEIQFG